MTFLKHIQDNLITDGFQTHSGIWKPHIKLLPIQSNQNRLCIQFTFFFFLHTALPTTWTRLRDITLLKRNKRRHALQFMSSSLCAWCSSWLSQGWIIKGWWMQTKFLLTGAILIWQWCLLRGWYLHNSAL